MSLRSPAPPTPPAPPGGFPPTIKFRQPGDEPADDERTLTEAYELWVEPEQFDNADATRSDYRTSLRYWKQATGDPPLRDVDDALMARFRDWFRTTRSLSAKTVQKHLKNVRRVLKRCGPYCPFQNPEGLDVLHRIPWCKPPRWRKSNRVRVNRIVPARHMDAIYRNARVMTWPDGPVPAPLFWRAALAMLWTYGPSIEDLFGFEFGRNILFDPDCPDPEIDEQNPHGWIHYFRRKTSVELVLPISAVVRRHLDAIAGRRAAVFPVINRPTSWMNARRDLQIGLIERPYTFQEMRKTANMTWKRIGGTELGIAVVGHKMAGVNAEWYTNHVPTILEKLPSFEYPAAMLDAGLCG